MPDVKAATTEEKKFIIELASADESEIEKITVNEPKTSFSEFTTEKTAAVLAAAKATVSGGGTLIQTKSGFDVDHIKQSYYVTTIKAWVDDNK